VPFHTRLRNDKGLISPQLTHAPFFICECCTVRIHVDRELRDDAKDMALLMLERMRFIDLLHAWAPSTLTQYNYKLQVLGRFGRNFGVPVLQATPLTTPPVSPAIPIMWAMQQYSLQPTQYRKKHDTTDLGTVSYGTVRGIRSAASMFYRLDYQIAHPGQALLDSSARTVLSEGVSPTDELSFYLMNKGMSRRLGDSTKPSAALLHRHVHYLDGSLDERYDRARTPALRLEIAKAGLANLTAWMGWLRAIELFSLRWQDVDRVDPADSAQHDIPTGTGLLLLALLEQTKTSQTRTADVVLAGETASGLNVMAWFDRIGYNLPAGGQPADYIFVHPSGKRWDSHYFRHTYLLPSLNEQRLQGDAHLQRFDGSPGNSLAESFWAMHSYRRGARTQVSKTRSETIRGATSEEVNEHGRWRQKRSAMDMPTAYLEWPISDRLAITRLCM
jgi:hypothetical protein